MVGHFFRNCFNSTKSRSTGFTNLINLKFQGHCSQKTEYFETKTHWEVCPIITSNWRENSEFLAISMYFFDNFLKLPFSSWSLQNIGIYIIPRVYYAIKPHPWGQKCLFCLFLLVFAQKNARKLNQPAYCTDLSQGGPFFWTHPVVVTLSSFSDRVSKFNFLNLGASG